MKSRIYAEKRGAVSLVLCLGCMLAFVEFAGAQGAYTHDQGVQVLTRGPMHEAFADAYTAAPGARLTVTRNPYDPIVELPPDHRPAGANVAWIPGYWGWDEDRTDFIWVSGVWRDIPPGRQWVPGYWAYVSGGSQWVSGFWATSAQSEITYLPSPPAPLDLGPSSPSPTPNHVWAPGCWIWQQSNYAWQPGYWVVQPAEWVWTPARYTWTPRGYVYVPGYWDHQLLQRGVIFAPVYYAQPVYTRPNYSYSPSTVIDLVAIAASLFVQTRSNHYYYGDYYDRRYEDRGYIPWYSRRSTHHAYDPLYASYRSTQLQRDPNWDRYIDDQFRYRREHVDARPPQTLNLQINFNKSQRPGIQSPSIIGRSLSDVLENRALPQKFTTVNMDERKQIESRGREVHRLQSERARLEAPEASKDPVVVTQPTRLRMPVSPITSREDVKEQSVRVPPPMPVAPKLQSREERGRSVEPQHVERTSSPPHL